MSEKNAIATGNHAESLERAIAFVEENLEANIQLEQVAEIACYSKFHFSRLFSTMTGEGLQEYIRKRRLTESAEKLLTSTAPILAIAQQYRFDSQAAYTRAFQDVFGITPGKYRKRGHKFVPLERYRLSPEDMDFLNNYTMTAPKIVELVTKQLIGMHTSTQLANNQIPNLWKTFMPRHKEVKNRVANEYLAVHQYAPDLKFEDFNPGTVYESWATVEVSDAGNVPEGMESRTLDGGLYAVFVHIGPNSTFHNTFNFIHYEWLPKSEYELDSRDHFEIMGEKYYGPEHPKSEEEIWIPIRKRNVES